MAWCICGVPWPAAARSPVSADERTSGQSVVFARSRQVRRRGSPSQSVGAFLFVVGYAVVLEVAPPGVFYVVCNFMCTHLTFEVLRFKWRRV